MGQLAVPGPAPDRAQTIKARVTSVVDRDTIRVRPLEATRRSHLDDKPKRRGLPLCMESDSATVAERDGAGLPVSG